MGKKKVSDIIKNQIVGLFRGGHSTNEIQTIIRSISKSCVAKTIIKYKRTGTVFDKPRSGRPRKTSITDDNAIYRLSRKFPKYSQNKLAQEINAALNNRISKQTIGRRLLDRNLGSYTAAHKPLLKREDKAKRIKFCKQLLRMSDSQINKIIFSDESNFQVINRCNKVLVRRHQNEKYSDRNIVPRLQGGGGSIGIWACITNQGSGPEKVY
jgi:transposase